MIIAELAHLWHVRSWHGLPARVHCIVHGLEARATIARAPIARATNSRLHAFTVLELLTTLALIIILLGLMVSLARYVRTNSADQLTRDVLLDLDLAIANYRRAAGTFPPATMPAADVNEEQLSTILLEGNRLLGETLRHAVSGGKPSAGDGGTGAMPASAMPASVMPDGAMVRDAWGRTVGYLPHQHPLIGMAPQNRPFVFSAGPDGKYLTRQDNLYSYEQTRADEPSPRPRTSGQRE